MPLSLHVLNNEISAGGVIIYEGESQLDKAPIVCIATLKTSNVKTGPMIQTWIMRSDINPMEAVKTNQDASVCGSCRHRGIGNGKFRSCYVNIGQAPLGIYRAYKRDKYSRTNDISWVADRYLRVGSYGEPTALPFERWDILTRNSSGHTGYTHTWKTCDQRFRQILMASVDTEEEFHQARELGWRTFRVRNENDPLLKYEFECPASEKGGHKRLCATCRACDGTKWDSCNLEKAATVSIIVHGSPAKLAAHTRVSTLLQLSSKKENDGTESLVGSHVKLHP